MTGPPRRRSRPPTSRSTAELIAVGTELLWGDRAETNTLMLCEALAGLGIPVAAKTVVGDSEAALARVLTATLARAPLIILTGGLGATTDDVTTRVVAKVTGRRLTLRDDVLAGLKAVYRRRGREMPPSSERQALLPARAEVLPNPVGTAPGFRLTHDGTDIIALPGVPSEMRAVFETAVAPWLSDRAARPIPRRTIQSFGLGELAVEERLADLFTATGCEMGLLASPRGVEIRLRAVGTDRSPERLSRVADEIRRRLGDAVYGVDGQTMEAVVGESLSARGLSLAVAESCTGGLVGHRLTDVPGSSRYFVGGWVTYDNRAKTGWLGVDPETVAAHGAVSEPVAAMMAQGACRLAGSDLGLALTGIAGPGGGTTGKPVGTLVVAVAHAEGTIVRRWEFRGPRAETKLAFSQYGLDTVRRFITAKG